MNYSNGVAGHRGRLRERFEAARTDGMHEYEVLELLLTYGIPRRDVKPIAKAMIERFEGLNGVLDASLAELRCVENVGASSATLVKLVKEICGIYLANRMKKRDVFASPEAVVQFASMKLAGLPHEAFMVIYLSTQNEVIAHGILNEGTVDQVAVYPRRILENAMAHHATGLIIVHNHPSGHTEPSEEDKRLTLSIKQAGRLIDVRLLDHIIVGKGGHFSFLERGIL